MFIYLIVFSLLLFILAHYFFAYKYLKADNESPKGLIKFGLIASVYPLVTLICFSYVFLQGGSSYAQYSQSHELWSFWYECWSALVLGVIPFGILVSISLFKDLTLKSHSTYSRLSIFIAYLVCCVVLVITVPDA